MTPLPREDDSSHEARAEALLGTCFEAEDPEAAIRDACARHPELAPTLLRVHERMKAFGLVDATPRDVDEAMPELPGFTLLEKLGQGGMGVVYRACQATPAREVAIKIVRPELLHFEGRRARFAREVDAVASLSHPNIVPILEVGEAKGVPWFSMEYVPGTTLAALLRHLRTRGTAAADLNGGDIERYLASCSEDVTGSEATRGSGLSKLRSFRGSWVEACVRIVEGIAGALEHAHERGVLHRDVKPSNIMITLDGRVQLLDFGLARTADALELTASTAELGSLPYLAPEVLRGSALPSEALDVYSLGVTLREALALENPFLAETPHKTRNRVLEAKPKPLRKLNSQVAWDLETVCATAMAPEREQRYASMTEFRGDLERLREKLPIRARRAGALLRVRRWQQRHPAISVGLVCTLLVAALASYLLLLNEQRAGRAVSDALVESERQRGVAERALYASRLALAQSATTSRNFELARTILDACDPSRRSWSWKHQRLVAESYNARYDVTNGGSRVALSPDGRWIVCLAQSGQLGILDARSGEVATRVSTDARADSTLRIAAKVATLTLMTDEAIEVRSLPRGELLQRIATAGREYDATLSADARSVWTIDTQGRIRERDVRSGETKNTTAVQSERAQRYGLRVYAGAQPRFASFVLRGDTIRIEDARGERPKTLLSGRKGVVDACFARGGAVLALLNVIVTRPKSVVETFDTRSAKLLRRSEGPSSPSSIKASHDDRFLGVASNSLYVYRLESLQVAAALHGHHDIVRDCAFDGESRVWASALNSGKLCVWDLDDIVFRSDLAAHETTITTIGISPDSRFIVSGDKKGFVEVHDVRSQKKIARAGLHGGRVRALAFTKDGRIASAGADGVVRVVDPQTLDEARALRLGKDVYGLERVGERFAVLTDSGAMLHTLDEGAQPRRLAPRGARFLAAGARRVALADPEGKIEILDVDAGSRVRFDIPGKIVALDLSADGARLACLTQDRQLRLYDAARGDVLQSWKDHIMRPSAIRFAPQGHEFFTTTWGGALRFWDTRYEQNLGLVALETMILAMDASADGHFLAIGGINRKIMVLWATRER